MVIFHQIMLLVVTLISVGSTFTEKKTDILSKVFHKRRNYSLHSVQGILPSPNSAPEINRRSCSIGLFCPLMWSTHSGLTCVFFFFFLWYKSDKHSAETILLILNILFPQTSDGEQQQPQLPVNQSISRLNNQHTCIHSTILLFTFSTDSINCMNIQHFIIKQALCWMILPAQLQAHVGVLSTCKVGQVKLSYNVQQVRCTQCSFDLGYVQPVMGLLGHNFIINQGRSILGTSESHLGRGRVMKATTSLESDGENNFGCSTLQANEIHQLKTIPR